MTQPPHAPLDPAAALLEVSEATVARITDAFSQLGAKADFDDAVGGLLAQLLDKSMLYAPLKAICEHFPRWLSEHRESLPAAEYSRRGRQYQVMQQLVLVYETVDAGSSFAQLASLMQEAQAFGMPPAEITSAIAPGLRLAPDGAFCSGEAAAAAAPPS